MTLEKTIKVRSLTWLVSSTVYFSSFSAELGNHFYKDQTCFLLIKQFLFWIYKEICLHIMCRNMLYVCYLYFTNKKNEKRQIFSEGISNPIVDLCVYRGCFVGWRVSQHLSSWTLGKSCRNSMICLISWKLIMHEEANQHVLQYLTHNQDRNLTSDSTNKQTSWKNVFWF